VDEEFQARGLPGPYWALGLARSYSGSCGAHPQHYDCTIATQTACPLWIPNQAVPKRRVASVAREQTCLLHALPNTGEW